MNRRRALVTLCLLSLVVRGAAGTVPPRVAIEGPQDLAAATARLRQWRAERLIGFQRLIGLEDAGEPIRVVLAREDSVVAGGAPPWVAGYARSDGLIVLFPSRVPIYPYSSLDELLGHEVAHVLVARAAAGREVPRWFNEGLAMLAEEGWGWDHEARAALALVRGQSYALADLDGYFAGSRDEVAGAYALSAGLVRSFVGRYGRQMPAGVLHRVANGETFERAFEITVGVSLEQAETDYWRRQAFWNHWLPFLGNPTTLWIAISLLAIWAIKRRRDRDRERAAEWAASEQIAGHQDPPDSETVH
jgi:hypothetical protein